MKIDIITLFPDMFEGPFDESIIKRAQERGLVEINIHNLRKWAKDKHKTVDGRPFGGGPGMILRVDVVDRALKNLRIKESKNTKFKKRLTINRQPVTILLSAKGQKYTQKMAQKLAKNKHLILIAGHYEGIDHRVHEHLVDEVISIGDYILTGGEIPVMVLADSIVRLSPGVLGNPQSLDEESFSLKTESRQLTAETEYPQYTRPEDYKGWKVPEVLLSGNHKEIKNWREKNKKNATAR